MGTSPDTRNEIPHYFFAVRFKFYYDFSVFGRSTTILS
ncbi:hypothetical protein HMPREF9176_0857 [Streptococcus downei F0415]|nr:hypothetical protein HMPREF9176_0857 [Streptococcus downei F0415]